MATSPRRAREIARTREDILVAAARAFSAKGYKSATMQDIAREAGYTAASLYSYFASKEEIVRSLFESIRSELEAIHEMPMPAGLTFRQRLELMMRRQLEVTERHRASFKLLHCGGGGVQSFCPAAGDGEEAPVGVEIIADDFARFIRAHATPADLGGHEVEEAALMLGGMAHAFFVRWLRSGDAIASPMEGLARFLDLFFHGLLGPRTA